MAESKSPDGRAVSVEDLIALNDEIASLVRMGVPLELGLRGTAESACGRLRGLSGGLAERMRAGASLTDALAAEGDRIPAVYHAVVTTGLKAGRLPEAMEALTRFSQSVLEMRQHISLALLYPFLILAMAYALFVGYMIVVVPELIYTYEFLRIEIPYSIAALRYLGQTMGVWGFAVPAIMLFLVAWWVASGRYLLSSGERNGSLFARLMACTSLAGIPGIGAVLANFHRANFTQLTALLVEHDTPLHEAIHLAALATGNGKIIKAEPQLTRDLEAGRPLADALKKTSAFPPFMQWMMGAGEQQGTLPSSLRQITEIYRQRAVYQSRWIQLGAPIALIATIGGGATLLYALSVVIPLTEFWASLNVG